MLIGGDIQQLKDYVGSSDGGMQKQAASTVRLHVNHSNLEAKFLELRLDLHVRSHYLHKYMQHSRSVQQGQCSQ